MDSNLKNFIYIYIHNGVKWYAMPVRTCDNWCDAEFCTFFVKHEINCFILYLFYIIIWNSNLKILFTFIYISGWKWYAMPIKICDNWCDVEFCTFETW